MVLNHGKCSRIHGRIQRRRTGFYIKSDEVCICPECRNPLKYRDRVLRGQKQIGGERKMYMINRLQCTNKGCRKLHRQLTDGMIKYKQYSAEAIEDAIDGVISEEDGLKSPCDGSMKHWRWWFMYNRKQIEGHLRSAEYHLHGFEDGSAKRMGSLLEEIRENISPGWLGKVCRIVNNIGGSLQVSDAFGISVPELISGYQIKNANVSANMMRSRFYICPVCGNVIHSTGEAVVHCHGIQLLPAEAEQTDEEIRIADFSDASKPAGSPRPSGGSRDEHHMIFIERVEDEYFVRINHEMTKTHYISFIAAVSSDRCQMVKLYPEGEAEARFKISGVRKIYFYCNRDGLFCQDFVKGIDDKESGYDDTQERMELEQAADMLFG